MDGATPSAFKEMKQLAKFVMDTDNYGLHHIKSKEVEDDGLYRF
jgi:hypothetical protein